MWFDVDAALAEIEARSAVDDADRPAPRVAHVARVARPAERKSGTRSEDAASPGASPRALEGLALDERDHYEERAAILEFDGVLDRREAERRALREVAGSRAQTSHVFRHLTCLWPSGGED